MLTRSSLRFKILLALGILIVANILLSKFFFRLDFTGDKRYTLSGATKNILSNLQEPITVTAYFSEELPPPIRQVKQDFKDMLVEYANRSGGNVVYEFINPNKNDSIEQRVMQEGISPQVISVRERDNIKQQRAYLGAKLQYAGKTEIIPIIQPGAAMEYGLSSKIKKLSGVNKPIVGFVTGQQEETPATMVQAAEEMKVLYDVQNASLADTALSRFKTLIIVQPKDSFQQADLAALDNFLAQGKGILVALNRVEANLQTMQGEQVNTGLETWLAQKGINIAPDFVVDAKCGTITVQRPQQTPFGTMNVVQQMQFPYFPMISRFGDHQIVKGIEQVILPFASSLVYSGNRQFTPLLFSSATSGSETLPLTFDINKQIGDYAYNKPNLVLGGLVEGNLVGNSSSRLVVFADGDFAVNGAGEEAQRLSQDNISLLVNAVDYLSDDTGLNELRTKGVTSRPIEKELSDGQKSAIKWFNLLLPIGLVLGYGILRSQRRKRERQQWQTERF